MAFSALERKCIERLVGGLRRRRTRPDLADQLRFIYEVDGQSVILAEERPDWRDPTKLMHRPFAKLRFVRTTGAWTPYWLRADLCWHRYAPASPTAELATLVEVIDRDE